MPHIPLSFRDPPPSLAPHKAAEALGVNLPQDLPPRDKPTYPVRGKPRRRGYKSVRITEKPVNMGEWDVSPLRIASELGV